MLVARLCLGRFGVRRFERDVNELLAKGYRLQYGPNISNFGLFRVLCVAMFTKP